MCRGDTKAFPFRYPLMSNIPPCAHRLENSKRNRRYKPKRLLCGIPPNLKMRQCLSKRRIISGVCQQEKPCGQPGCISNFKQQSAIRRIGDDVDGFRNEGRPQEAGAAKHPVSWIRSVHLVKSRRSLINVCKVEPPKDHYEWARNGRDLDFDRRSTSHFSPHC